MSLEQALKLTLVIFMAGNLLDMGLRLQLSKAINGLRDLRFTGLSLLWGFLLLPAFAWALARVLPLEPGYGTGLILLGMTPCAPFLPPMVERARGDMGYAAAFMLLASVVTVAYVPLAVPVLASGLSADPLTIAKPLVLFLLVPFAIGLAIRRRNAGLAAKLDPIVKKMTGIDTLLMLVLCAVVYGRQMLGLVGTYAIGAELLFFAGATAGPYLVGFGMPPQQKAVLSLGMATRNLGAAFAPLLSVPNVDQRAVVVVALGVLMQTAFSVGAASYYRHSGRTI
jgi:bile acid:Na+ symporter, BASS family